MKAAKTIGWSLIFGAVGVFIPYTILTITFDYPDILRYEAGVVLERFHQGGGSLVLTWLAFALLGTPLLVGYKLIGEQLAGKVSYAGWATTIGITSIVVQLIGLLRWVFVVPVLANNYVAAKEESLRSSIVIAFTTIHQFGGVLLGEHIGQLFTVIWTIAVVTAFHKLKWMPRWLNYFGVAAAIIYLFAQAELLATVIPDFPFWGMAGFIGSTLWLIWLIMVAYRFIRMPEIQNDVK